MEKNFALPGFTEMTSKINAFQKENFDRIMKTVNETFGEKNPMKMFYPGKTADNTMPGNFSEFIDITEKMFKGMMEISTAMMPGLSNDDKNSMNIFTKNMPETSVQIMKKLLENLPEGTSWAYKEKINKVLDKLAVYNTAAIGFFSCTFIPVEEDAQIKITEIINQAKSVKSPQEIQDLCTKWLKIIEDGYKSLLKADRYKDILEKSFIALDEYRSATEELVLEIIQLSGLPINKKEEKPEEAKKKNAKKTS